MLYDGIICDIKNDDDGYAFLYKCNIRKKDIFLKNPNKFVYFIAYINNVPVGKCEVFFNEHLLRIESLLVSVSYRNKGIASSILNAIKEFAQQKKHLNNIPYG